ncbi:MAG: dihydrolipoyl dehydrogenase family protein [Rhodopirellula sp. JB044]|uniref:dihydrolipoyl dehydrogenase family protein n=1 Tax=Rhodopirellula sp. JB044 TaxID=3342844 RepID=UPI00370CF672
MSEHQIDIVVLGSGPAGSTVATKLVKRGYSVAMIETREFGGTCALRGCNPKKVYVNAAEIIDRARRSEGKLIVGSDGVKIDWAKLLQFKREFTQPVVEKTEKSYRSSGIQTFQGTPSFDSPTSIVVGSERIVGKKFIIATGATPAPVGIPGAEHITTSDDFLELSNLPERVVFIGGGYISMEFAHVAARCGTHVTIVDRNERVLSGFDPDLIDLLTQYSEKRGIHFRLGVSPTSIVDASGNGSDHRYRIEMDKGPALDAGLVVHGAGRVPNVQGLELSRAAISFSDQGVSVNDAFRSVSNENVYAIGDCAATGKPRLTPTANEEARIVVKNLLEPGEAHRADYGAIPKVAFTTPSIAAVGMSEEDARKSHDVDVRADDMSSWGSVRKTGGTAAGYKILVDRDNDRVLGAHLLGPSAEETINLFALAMKFGLTATDIKSTLFAFPTSASDVRSML